MRQHRPHHADVRLPIIIINVSARIPKFELCACRAEDISGHSDGVPDERRAANPFGGHHDVQEDGASFSKKLQVVEKSYIKSGVAILNRTFIAMHPLELYYLNQAGRGLTTP